MSTDNIKLFIRTNYSDSQLAALIAHTESGKLSFHSCCCLVGIPTAPHALKGLERVKEYHLICTPLAMAADKEFHDLGWTDNGGSDCLRRERLRPLVLAEMERREQERDYEGEEEPWSDSQGMMAMVNSIKGR